MNYQDSPIKTVGELVKDHGLVVLAIITLVWQVWFITTMLREQQIEWHQTLSELTQELKQERAQRSELIINLTAVISSLQETATATKSLLGTVEDACKFGRPIGE